MSAGRYGSSRQGAYVSPNGVRVTYLIPRMLPLAGAPAGRTAIAPGEVHRLDLVANRTLSNPLLAYRLADANDAMNPFDVCASAGKVINVPGAGL